MQVGRKDSRALGALQDYVLGIFVEPPCAEGHCVPVRCRLVGDWDIGMHVGQRSGLFSIMTETHGYLGEKHYRWMSQIGIVLYHDRDAWMFRRGVLQMDELQIHCTGGAHVSDKITESSVNQGCQKEGQAARQKYEYYLLFHIPYTLGSSHELCMYQVRVQYDTIQSLRVRRGGATFHPV